MDAPVRTTAIYRKNLPHWEMENGLYFTTISLHGAIPASAAAEIHEMSRRLEKEARLPAYERSRIVFREMERWLDRNYGHRWLEIPAVATTMMEIIEHNQALQIWDMHEYVLMPTHAHFLFQFLPDAEQFRSPEGRILDGFLPQYKKYSGRRANAILDRIGERFWQREWFDHWIRNEAEAQRTVQYIRNNPVKAGLVRDYLDWPYGSWAKR